MLRKLIRDEHGVSLLVTAISLSVMLGFTALGVETSMWYTIVRHNQSAADMAALSGAMELASGQSSSDVCTQAKNTAVLNGFPESSVVCNVGLSTSASQSSCEPPPNGTLLQGQMCVSNPPLFGSYTCSVSPTTCNNYVEVVLGWQQATWFSSIATGCNNPGNATACAQSSVTPLSNVPLYTRGVALVKAPPGGAVACILALTTTGTGISDSGGGTVSMPNCGAVSDSTDPSSFSFQGASTTFDPSYYMTNGGVNISGNPTVVGNRYYGSLKDPYSCSPPTFGCLGTITWPTISGSEITNSCTGGSTLATAQVLIPGTYSGPICATSGYFIVCPGVYVIDGAENQNPYGAMDVSGTSTVVQMGTAGTTYNGKTCPSSTMANGQTINGVTFIASSKTGTKGGGFDIKQANITLSAPTSSPRTGIPSGLLFAQDPNHANTQKNGNGLRGDSSIQTPTSAVFTGSMYTPDTNINLQAQVNSTCFIVIALTVGFQGGATLAADPQHCQAAGVNPPPEVLTAGFAE